MSGPNTPAPTRMRLDKWLWQARFFKTRALASKIAGSGTLRLNGQHVHKPAQLVALDDVLSFAQAGDIRIIKIRGFGTRRGPASEAQALYEDLSPVSKPAPQAKIAPHGQRKPGSGRPTKHERREIDAFRRYALEASAHASYEPHVESSQRDDENPDGPTSNRSRPA